MLSSIAVENFKRHEHLETDFKDNLNVIVGSNFVGKTSLLQAALVAFFGPTALPGGAKVATRKGAKGFKVGVQFTADGKEYTVSRTKTKAELSRDGKVIANSVSQVTKEIEDILGMTRKRFLQVKYGQQKRTEALLTLGAADLHSLIEEVTGADLISRVIDRLKQEQIKVSTRLEDLQLPEETLTDLRKQAKDARKKADQAETQAKAEQVAVTHLQGELEKATEALDTAQRHNTKVRELTVKRMGWEERIQAAQESISTTEKDRGECPDESELAEAREAAESAKAAVDKADSAVEAMSRAHKTMAKAKEEGVAIRTQIESLDTTGPSREDLLKAEAEYARCEKALSDAERRKNESEKGLSEAVCYACGRPFEEHDEAQLKAHKDQAETDIREWEPKFKDVENRLTLYRQQDNAAFKARTQAEGLQSQYEKAKTAFSEAKQLFEQHKKDALNEEARNEDKKALQQASLALSELNDRLSKWTYAEDFLIREKGILAEAQEALSQIEEPDPLVDPGPLEAEVVQTRGYLQEQQQATHTAMQEARSLSHEAGVIETRLYDAEDKKKRHKELKARGSNIKQLTKFLRDNRDRFLSDVWAGIMAQASEFASTCTGGYIEQVQRGDEGRFIYIEDGKEQPIEAASGAQASIIGLGVQLALSRMLPSGFDCTLLDEPTADMADDTALALTTALASLPQQVVMVSHRQYDGSASENVIQLER